MGPVLAFFAHPDDETFCCGGVLAAAAGRGLHVTVVSATRGEAGESSIPGLDDPDALGAVRENELREATHRLGVHDVRVLGYRDSGLGDGPNADRRAFTSVPVQDVAARLVPIIREVRPEVVVTFGPDGMYGHPDHLHAHQAGIAAVIAAGDPTILSTPDLPAWKTGVLYFATSPRENMLALLDRPNSPLEFVPAEARAKMGTPRAEITNFVPIADWAEAKRAALAAHVTQTGEGGPLASIPPEAIQRQLEWEYFVRFALPRDESADRDDIISLLSTAPDPT